MGLKCDDIVVIGGGAAGFFGATHCAGNFPDRRVLLLEASGRLLTKVRISGGGRCNVTHHCFDPGRLISYYPRGSRELRGAFSRFQPRDTVAWFADRGVILKTESDGRMFPVTDQSATIVGCLEEAAREAGVQISTKTPVRSITALADGGFRLQTNRDDTITAAAVLLATGSAPAGHDLAGSLGHRITPLAPSLFTFRIEAPLLQGLPGQTVPRVRLQLHPAGAGRAGRKMTSEGPLLFTHRGLSGPAVLRLSAFAARELQAAGYEASLQVSFLPDSNPQTCFDRLRGEDQDIPMERRNPEGISRRLFQRFLQLNGIDGRQPASACNSRDLRRLAESLTRHRLDIRGKDTFKEEFVTCGGVDLREVDFRTMESRICPGLYFAGEVLDVDGVTGGFNFQNAWTTAWIAAGHMGRTEPGTGPGPTA